MAAALTTAQISRMRAAVNTTLQDTITILRETRLSDDGGGYETDYLVWEEDVPASVGLPLGGETDERAASTIRLADEDLHTIRLPAKTDVIKTDRIVWTDAETGMERTFEVNAVLRRGTYELTGRVRVKELLMAAPVKVAPESVLGGGDKPGMQPRWPAGMPLGGEWTTTERLRATGYGYVAIRYQSRFNGIIAALSIRARVVEKETAEEIRDDAASRAPVWDGPPYTDIYGQHGGILRDSLYVEELDGAYAVASDVHYAPYLEFGTARHNHHDAQPFLIPAMEDNRESFIARMAAGVQRL